MELQQLKYFCIIAQCESLTKAVKKLHMSQPSLSRSLRSLEKELGTPLFDRVGRNIVLNDAGRFALKRALGVLDSAEAIKHDIDKFLYDGNLSVDVYSPAPMGAADDIIIGFKKKYPDVRVRMASWPSERLKDIQPGITFFASPVVHKEPNYLMLGEEDIVLAVSKDSPFAQRESVRLADLENERFLSVLSDSPFYELCAQMFAQAGFEPHIAAEDQDHNRILTYTANDFGVALAPSITWLGNWKRAVAAIPISDVHQKRYLYLKWPENTMMNWGTLCFRDYLIEYFNTTYGFTCSLEATPDPDQSDEPADELPAKDTLEAHLADTALHAQAPRAAAPAPEAATEPALRR